MTNYEWLLNMGGEERQAWFDAEHVELCEGSSKVRAGSSKSAKRAAAVERLKNSAGARFSPDAIVCALLDGRCGNVDWSLECDAIIDLLTDEPIDAQRDSNGTCPDGNGTASNDSREKLEAEVSNFGFIMNLEGYQLDMIHGWLNRQAAITERELCKQCEWPSLAAQPDYESQGRIVALTAKVDELTAERDALADDLLTCNKEREQYRELFSKSLTLAAEIVNLQP